jgi:hypothetical protein
MICRFFTLILVIAAILLLLTTPPCRAQAAPSKSDCRSLSGSIA